MVGVKEGLSVEEMLLLVPEGNAITGIEDVLDPDVEFGRDPLNPVGTLRLLLRPLDSECWLWVPGSVSDEGTVPLDVCVLELGRVVEPHKPRESHDWEGVMVGDREGELDGELGGEEDWQRPRAIPRAPQRSVD